MESNLDSPIKMPMCKAHCSRTAAGTWLSWKRWLKWERLWEKNSATHLCTFTWTKTALNPLAALS